MGRPFKAPEISSSFNQEFDCQSLEARLESNTAVSNIIKDKRIKNFNSYSGKNLKKRTVKVQRKVGQIVGLSKPRHSNQTYLRFSFI